MAKATLARPPAGALPVHVLELGHGVFREEVRERLRMQESLAQACFRSLVLVNGGAVIALFSLIGSNAEVARQVSGLALWIAFAAFAGGLAATISANVSAYFMQLHYASMTERHMWNKELLIAGREPGYDVESCLLTGDRWQRAAVVCVVLSLALFATGAALCILAFLG